MGNGAKGNKTMRTVKWTFACVVIVGLLLSGGCSKSKSKKDKSLERIAPVSETETSSLPKLERKKTRRESGKKDLTPMGYLTIVVRSKNRGRMITSTSNLRSLGKDIEMYKLQEGEYPASLEELVKAGTSRELTISIASDRPIAYICPAGSRPDPNDVIAFDPVNYLNNRFVVLYINGVAENVNIDQLKQQLEKQGVK